jgi:protein O-GlcNAc transferase
VLLDRLAAAQEDSARRQAMWELANLYKRVGQTDKAMDYLRRLLETAEDLEARAQIILTLGQTAEKMRDYAMAVDLYRQALAHEPLNPVHWYFIHNNLGYSLVQLGEFAKAEKYCRAAIQINPNRANGFKNLGLALQGQGRYREAARSFVDATRANAADARSFGHLEALLKDHPELQLEFGPELECCRKAVALVAEKLAQAEAAWQPRQKGDQP